MSLKYKQTSHEFVDLNCVGQKHAVFVIIWLKEIIHYNHHHYHHHYIQRHL